MSEKVENVIVIHQINAMASIIDEGIDSETVEVLSDSKFRQNFELMRLSGEMCDVTISVENSHFKAHKLILAGCSPYFRCMFGQKKFTEADLETVAIDPKGKLIRFGMMIFVDNVFLSFKSDPF